MTSRASGASATRDESDAATSEPSDAGTDEGPAAAPKNAGGPGKVRRVAAGALMLGALGVVFGDIGTSPLYALQTVFSIDNGAVRPTPGDVFGVISLVFWSVTLIVSVKYVLVVMRADNDGEGGVMALAALARRVLSHASGRTGAVLLLGVLGASLFYGDSVITPAISVLSAVEGVKVTHPGLGSAVVPIAGTILVALFAAQRWGTHRVGALFGPVMALWFGVLAVAGLREAALHPRIVVVGLSPTYAVGFVVSHPFVAFVALGAVVLSITGAEALYADMGHFGRPAISRAWFFIAFPALTLNYLGQGALILHTPSAVVNPFFLLIPSWGRLPMVGRLHSVRDHHHPGRTQALLPRHGSRPFCWLKSAQAALIIRCCSCRGAWYPDRPGPTPTELSRVLGLSVKDVKAALHAGAVYRALSLDAAPSTSGHVAEEYLRDESTGISSEDWLPVAAAVRRLPERDRQVIYLRFFEDLSQSDIARQIGVSQMQVSRILSRTLRVLHDELGAA